MKSSVFGLVGVSMAALLSSPVTSRRAHAFGGSWSSQTVPVKHAAEKIVFVDNPDSTVTAIIQIEYAGPSQKFAWIIPVAGKPTIGTSSNAVFERLEAATVPEYLVEVAVEGTCRQQEHPKAPASTDLAPGGASSITETTAAPVREVEQGSVGPYDYVNIRVDPARGDPVKAATDWLAKSGYDLTGVDSKLWTPYLSEGKNLVAFKLTKGADARAIRPVVLTYESKLPMIPLRPTSASARDDMGIQVWVFGPSQAVPENYKSLVLNEALIDWLSGGKYVAGTLPGGGAGAVGPYASKPSNYDAVVTAAANEAGGRGFVTELGGPASQYREKVWSSLDEQTFATISKEHYANGVDAISAAARNFGGWDGWREAIRGATTLPAGVTVDEFDRNLDRYRGVAKIDTLKFFRMLNEQVVKPVADTAALFYKAPYLTRLYGTMSPGEMTVDPVFDYNADLAQVGNPRVAKQFIQCNPTLDQNEAPWRMQLPHGGVIVGKGGGWPVAVGSMPANLAIGGARTVTLHGEAASTPRSQEPSRGGKCSVASVGAATGSVLAPWSPLVGIVLARRRRSRSSRGSERSSIDS